MRWPGRRLRSARGQEQVSGVRQAVAKHEQVAVRTCLCGGAGAQRGQAEVPKQGLGRHDGQLPVLKDMGGSIFAIISPLSPWDHFRVPKMFFSVSLFLDK